MHDDAGRQSCILFFVKYPIRGNVKTRLSETVDDGSAVMLYRHFVTDLLSTLERVGRQVVICYSPAGREDDFRRWLGSRHRYLRQRGDNLGERLKHGFMDAFAEGLDRAVAVGSDSPDLPAGFIREAFSQLSKNTVVVGPAVDGGYYLIGFTGDGFLPAAFDGIEWSTPTVLDETIRRIRQADRHLDIHRLPPWRDVDTLEDLHALYRRNRNHPYASSETMRYISEHLL